MTGTRRHLLLPLLLLFPGLVFAQTVPPDVEGYWAEGRIRELITRRIVEVFPDGTFRPQETLSSARFVAWLVAVKGLPLLRADPAAFPDVPPPTRSRGAAPIHWPVRALGHTFESAYMASAALPFEDTTGLPAPLRGIVAVAALSTPPLLREPPSARLRPRDPTTRGEAASLVWAYLQALEQPAALRATFPLGDGVTLVLEKRGALRPLPVWRGEGGAF